jgi:hypothetical protein
MDNLYFVLVKRFKNYILSCVLIFLKPRFECVFQIYLFSI